MSKKHHSKAHTSTSKTTAIIKPLENEQPLEKVKSAVEIPVQKSVEVADKSTVKPSQAIDAETIPSLSEAESAALLAECLKQEALVNEAIQTVTSKLQEEASEAVQTEYFNREADKIITGSSYVEINQEIHVAESNAQENSQPPVVEEQPPMNYPRLDDKYRSKDALRDRLWLRKDYKPIIAYVGRLDSQKGVHLIHHAIFYALSHNAQFVLLGSSPERNINDHFWHLKQTLNDNPDCHLEIGFNEELSHLIYAGSDMIVMPSMYEPCGLAQMIALKYGTVPIVRSVGGLKDTIFDRDYSHKPMHERNGYVFHNADHAGLESALERAIGLWFGYPEDFRQLVINGMKCDYSWNYPGQHYVNIYEYVRCK